MRKDYLNSDVTHFVYQIIFELPIERHEAIYFNFLSQATTLSLYPRL